MGKITAYELQVFPAEILALEQLEQLKQTVMEGSLSPYPVVDIFGRVFAAFCSYRLAMDAAVAARLLCDCSIRVIPFELEGDIDVPYALVPYDGERRSEA